MTRPIHRTPQRSRPAGHGRRFPSLAGLLLAGRPDAVREARRRDAARIEHAGGTAVGCCG